MSSLRLLDEGKLDLLVAFSLDESETMDEAIVDAFLAADIDVFEKSTRLDDWINTGVFEALRWSSDRWLYLCVRIWDHPMIISSETVRIYTVPESV